MSNTTDYSVERKFIESLGIEPKNDIPFWNQNHSKYEMYDTEYLLSKFKQHLIESGEFIETNSLSECELHGHGFQPVLGFSNEISDYQCVACGVFESDMTKPETNYSVISDDDIEAQARRIELAWTFNFNELSVRKPLIAMAKWMQEQLNKK